jgi:hypothetical protein
MKQFVHRLSELLKIVMVGMVFVVGILCIVASNGNRYKITDSFPACRSAAFDYKVAGTKQEPSGYTIGIIQTQFVEVNPQDWTYIQSSDPRERANFEQFKKEISNSLEQILLTKGCTVAGPFASYEEMTFPERQRCAYLIKPVVTIDFRTSTSVFSRNDAFEGPRGESYVYASGTRTIDGKCEMEYVILDPLTNEKMERHKLRTQTVNVSFPAYAQGYLDKNGTITRWVSLKSFAKENPEENLNQAYSNADCPMVNAGTEILQNIYGELVRKAEELISLEEFKNLDKYKDEIRKRKTY